MKQLHYILILILSFGFSAIATANNFTVTNTSRYIVECVGVVGGSCSHNPVTGKHAKNSNMMAVKKGAVKAMIGHLMVIDKQHPGQYVDNIIFKYGNNGLIAKSLYGKVKVKLKGNNLVI